MALMWVWFGWFLLTRVGFIAINNMAQKEVKLLSNVKVLFTFIPIKG